MLFLNFLSFVLSEFLAKDSLEAFWKFVDTVTLHPLHDNGIM